MESQSSEPCLALVPVETLDSLHTQMRQVQPPVQKKARVYLSSQSSWVVFSSITIRSPVVGSSFIL